MVRTKVNKSKAVREYLEMHPNSSPAEVVGALALEGIPVVPGLVSNIKTKRGGKRRIAAKAAKPSEPVFGISVLVAAKRFSDATGGVDNAKMILEVLAKLQ